MYITAKRKMEFGGEQTIKSNLEIKKVECKKWNIFVTTIEFQKEFLWVTVIHDIFINNDHLSKESLKVEIEINQGRFYDSVFTHSSINFVNNGQTYQPVQNHSNLIPGKLIRKELVILIDPKESDFHHDLLITSRIRVAETVLDRFYNIDLSFLEHGVYNNSLKVE